MRAALEAGEPTFGVQVATASEAVIEVCGAMGLDYVWIDVEHKGISPYDGDAMERRARAAELAGTELLVRLPGTDPDVIRKVLDAGVRNVLVSRVESADEVRRAVEAARFTYEGEPGQRGSAFARANRYGNGPGDYAERADRTVCVGAMIENDAAVGNADGILSVPELGFVRIGPGDLSVSLGNPMEKFHPAVEDRIRVVEERASEHGVPIGRGFGDAEAVRDAVERGYQLITIGRDIDAFRSVIAERFDRVRGR